MSNNKWNFDQDMERKRFLDDVDRRGPPVLWIYQQTRRRPTSVYMSAAACAVQHRKRRLYVLVAPLGCDTLEKKELKNLMDNENGKLCFAGGQMLVTNWDRLQGELEHPKEHHGCIEAVT